MANTNYLTHHGINGQRWGRLNGPPYPLDYEDHSPAEMRLNPTTALDNYGYRPTAGQRVKAFAKAHKKELMIGGAVVTAIAVEKAHKYVKKTRNENVATVLGYYENRGAIQDLGKRFYKSMEKDLRKMKFSDLQREAESVRKNGWSSYTYKVR